MKIKQLHEYENGTAIELAPVTIPDAVVNPDTQENLTDALERIEGAIPTKVSQLTNDSGYATTSAMNTALGKKVDAVSGKGLSTNDYTTTEKTKLSGIASGAEVNQNAFSNVTVGSTTIEADSKTDTLTLAAGSNITITPDATNDKITIAATNTNTTYTFAGGTGGFTVTPSGGSAQTVSIGKPSTAGTADKAAQLSTARTLDGVSFNGTAGITHYGECSTAAATAAKTVSLTGFTLVTGARVMVKFTVTNTASSPTLNVNSTGAKGIMYRGSAISAGYLAANRVYEFVYDGTDYELVGDINTDTNTTYSLVGANGTTGLIKNGSSVTSASGYTASPIISGVPYYKNTTYSAATTDANGLMTSAMVTKLNGIATGATANTGTITGIKMNGASKGTSGVVDLGTVITAHQDISGKLDATTAASTYLTKTDAASTYLGKTAKAASATSADSATKATQDASGNVITSTYATKSALSSLQTQVNTLVSGDASSAIESFNEIIAFLEGVEDTETLDGIIAGINTEIAKKADKNVAISNITRSGTTFTATRADGTTFTFTQQDNNTTYTFAGGTNKFTVTPSGGSAQTVSVTPSISNNVTYSGTLTSGQVAVLDGTTGKIKASGCTIATSVPSDAKFTDTTYSAMSASEATTGTATTARTITAKVLNDKISEMTEDLDFNISVVDHGTSDTSFALTPNVFHKWGTVTALTLTLADPTDSTVYNEYMFEFVSGTTATSLSLPSTIKWVATPTVAAGKTYQCSIVNNVGVIMSA